MTSPAAPPPPPLFPPPSLHLGSSASVPQMGIWTRTRVIEGGQSRSFSPVSSVSGTKPPSQSGAAFAASVSLSEGKGLHPAAVRATE